MDIVVTALANSVGSEAVGETNDVSRPALRDNGLFAQSLHDRIAGEGGSVTQAGLNQGADTLTEIHTGAASQVLDDSGTAVLLGVSPRNAKNLKESAIIASGSRGEEIFRKPRATIPTNIEGASLGQGGSNQIVPVAQQGRTQASYPKDVQVSASSGNGEEVAGEEMQRQQSLLQTVRAPRAAMAVMDGGAVIDVNQKKISWETELEKTDGSTKVISREPDNESKRSSTLKDAKSVGSKSVVMSKPADMSATQTVLSLVLSVPVPASVSSAVPAPILPVLVGGKQNAGGGSARRSSDKATVPTQKYVASPVPVKGKEGTHSGTMAVTDAEPVVVSPSEDLATRVGPDSAKAAVPVVPGKSDGDGKLPNGGASVSSSHSGAVMAGGATSLAAGLAPSHIAGTVVLSKVQSGDGGALMGAGHTSAPEHDGSGATVSPALDGGHRTLVATPTELEVGISSGSQGWLKIRAEMTGSGGVNASLSATIPAGQEMLHRELPSLTAYLQQERVAVNSVVIHTSAALGTSPGVGGGMGSGSQPHQRGDEGSANRSPGDSQSPNYIEEAGSSRLNTGDANGVLPLSQLAVGGSWLSVRA